MSILKEEEEEWGEDESRRRNISMLSVEWEDERVGDINKAEVRKVLSKLRRKPSGVTMRDDNMKDIN